MMTGRRETQGERERQTEKWKRHKRYQIIIFLSTINTVFDEMENKIMTV